MLNAGTQSFEQRWSISRLFTVFEAVHNECYFKLWTSAYGAALFCVSNVYIIWLQ